MRTIVAETAQPEKYSLKDSFTTVPIRPESSSKMLNVSDHFDSRRFPSDEKLIINQLISS
jgi:hypothetical protein